MSWLREVVRLCLVQPTSGASPCVLTGRQTKSPLEVSTKMALIGKTKFHRDIRERVSPRQPTSRFKQADVNTIGAW